MATLKRVYSNINEILDVVLNSDDSDIALEGESDCDSDWEYEIDTAEHFEPPIVQTSPVQDDDDDVVEGSHLKPEDFHQFQEQMDSDNVSEIEIGESEESEVIEGSI